MSSKTTYKRYLVSCLTCKSEITSCNFNKHLDSEQCTSSDKFMYKRSDLECIYCNKLCKSVNSVTQHEIRCKKNPNRIIINRIHKVSEMPATPCKFCNKIYTAKNNLNNHITRCPNNPDRKLHPQTEDGKKISQIKLAKYREIHWAKPESREKIKKIMRQAVIDHPESYMHANRGVTKQYIYNGVRCQGKWELAFYIWSEFANVGAIRCKEWFNYIWDGEHKYNPDFYIPSLNIYVEVKGYQTDRDIAKWDSITKTYGKTLLVIDKRSIKSIKDCTASLDILIDKYLY